MDLNGLRNPDFWKEYYQNVQRQVERIDNMLKDLWTASEKPAFEFADRVQLHKVIAETILQLKDSIAAKNILVDNQVPDSLPALNVDKPKFYRLFELLLKDELASLPAGSRITLSASLLNAARADNQQIQVQLSDNGPGLPEMAASYAAGIILNHPFVDGIKRTGFMLAAAFLELNGMKLAATEESVVEMTLALASGSVKQAAYAEWLKRNSNKS